MKECLLYANRQPKYYWNQLTLMNVSFRVGLFIFSFPPLPLERGHESQKKMSKVADYII